MLVLLASVVAVNASSLGWSIASNHTRSIIIGVLQTVFSLYLLILAGRSIKQNDVHSHTETVVHITALSIVATALFFTAAILPSTPPVTASITKEDVNAPPGLWYATLALYTLVFVISITTPLGPKLHFPPERIYSEKTIMATTNKDEENVCGVVGTVLVTFVSYSSTEWL